MSSNLTEGTFTPVVQLVEAWDLKSLQVSVRIRPGVLFFSEKFTQLLQEWNTLCTLAVQMRTTVHTAQMINERGGKDPVLPGAFVLAVI